MSLKTALKFIQQVRGDTQLRETIRALGFVADLEKVVRVGAEAGYAFTSEELRAAFKHDWGMRWMYYGGNMSEEQPLASGELRDDT